MRITKPDHLDLSVEGKHRDNRGHLQSNDLLIQAAEKALTNRQEKGLITGFVPGDLQAEITPTADAAKYTN